MNTIVHLATAVLIATLGAGAELPEAESSASRVVAAPAAPMTLPGFDLRRQPALGEALRAHGFRAERLGRSDERALADMMSELFPHIDPRRDRLTPNQAVALVYVALVHPGTSGRGAWRGRRSACEAVLEVVTAAERAFAAPGRSQPRYLSGGEVQRVRSATRDIDSDAAQCGDRRLADASADLTRAVAAGRVEREGVARQLARVRSLARLAVASS